MEASPLTQQNRPGTFQPKIVNLYEKLLLQDEDEHYDDRSEGFWKELFLHRPDSASFRSILDRLSADDLIHLQSHTQEFVYRALVSIQAHAAPSDENALETLTVFLGAVLSKRYTNPSSDIIQVIAGLDNVDATFTELVAALDGIIRNGRTLDMRRKAIRTALSATAGAYQTGLVSYFTHRDLFPTLMKFVQDSEDGSQDVEAFVLLGLLANYNRFEFQNPYRMRLDDFVNDKIIKKIVKSLGTTCRSLRDSYLALQDDTPAGWGVSNTLSYIGLGRLSGAKPAAPALTEEVAKLRFTDLPDPEAAVLLSAYDFVQSNKLFCFDFVTMTAEGKGTTTALSEYVSLTSYLLQHAHRSSRASLYTYTTLFVLRILLEDQTLAKRICSDESKTTVRLCRQRQPFLPIVTASRPIAAAMLDIAIDGINHNLRRKLDVALYQLCLGLLHRIVAYLGATRTRLPYHWSELWRSMLSFIRFLNTYVADIKPMTGSRAMVDELVTVTALSLTTGESFLPDPASYDDLFYKLVETGEILIEFRNNYDLQRSAAVAVLESVSSHYHALLNSEGKHKFTKKHMSPREVSKIIKQGYDTLSIEAKEGLDQFNKFREADYRIELKKIARLAVDDAKALVREP